jgi:S-adenosylmethionine:tRNA ribosyltransferase-isomerase
MTDYKLTDFDYYLPPEMIAQYPSNKRSESKLMVVERVSKKIHIDKFSNILSYLEPSDLLVINETRVIPARLVGIKPTGAKVEVLLLEEINPHKWKCLVKPGRKLRMGDKIIFKEGMLRGEIVEHQEYGERVIEFSYEGDFLTLLDKIGKVPLPPYIKRQDIPEDKNRYQTVYAKKPGSVAAPTAGLHFTKELLEQAQEIGLEIVPVNLKIGLDTFRPVETENIKDHKIHTEFCEVPESSAKRINSAKKEGKKIVAVGTTSVRTLESFYQYGKVQTGRKRTDLFVYPGYHFKVVDKMITNFHLPKSTLLMLVSAFAGREFILEAYQRAIKENFRFYSYGDAMLIL